MLFSVATMSTGQSQIPRSRPRATRVPIAETSLAACKSGSRPCRRQWPTRARIRDAGFMISPSAADFRNHRDQRRRASPASIANRIFVTSLIAPL